MEHDTILYNAALQYLNADALSHIDMLENIRRGNARILYAGEDGVILEEKTDGTCMVSVADVERCKDFIQPDKYGVFSVHQKAVADWVTSCRTFQRVMEVYQAAYYKKDKFVFDGIENIRPLTKEHIARADQLYGKNNPDYLDWLVERGLLWGYFCGDVMAGFVGFHSDGSMGLLNIAPEYRGRGLGTVLESFIINRSLDLGHIPYCQVETHNAVSLALQKKMGLTVSSGTAFWLIQREQN